LCSDRLEALADAGENVQALREAALKLGRDELEGGAWVLALDSSQRDRLKAAVTGVPLTTKELAVAGRDLLAEKITTPGPHLGELLADLLHRCLVEPELNTRDSLIELAREWLVSRGE
jgi:hypothetical protein